MEVEGGDTRFINSIILYKLQICLVSTDCNHYTVKHLPSLRTSLFRDRETNV
jgi:hypothetical protein